MYLHVIAKGYPEAAPPEYYLPFEKRWIQTKMKFGAFCSHDIRILFCGGEPSDEAKLLYYNYFPNFTFDVYTGAGSDIGACQYAIRKIDSDFVVCMSTPVYFWKFGWLDCLLKAREQHGDGLYGPMASYEVKPHIRTSCWCVDPKTFVRYPYLIDTREKCCWAEHADHPGTQPWQISKWYQSIGKPVRMVTWDSSYEEKEWRTPPNIFRRGDQTNCIVWDQHVDFYFASHYHDRLALEKRADGR